MITITQQDITDFRALVAACHPDAAQAFLWDTTTPVEDFAKLARQYDSALDGASDYCGVGLRKHDASELLAGYDTTCLTGNGPYAEAHALFYAFCHTNKEKLLALIEQYRQMQVLVDIVRYIIALSHDTTSHTAERIAVIRDCVQAFEAGKLTQRSIEELLKHAERPREVGK